MHQYSSDLTPEDILRRFHHSVHEHYDSYAHVCMESMEYENFSELASISDVVLAGNNYAADAKQTLCVEDTSPSSSKAQLSFAFQKHLLL